jgi:hypothetical protein
MQQTASRTSYHIHEIASMRSMSEQAVLDDIYHGQLKAHTWLPMMVVEEMQSHKIGDQILYAREVKNYEGYICLHPRDVRRVMKFGKATVRSFIGCEDERTIVLSEGAPDYCVEKSDLIILDDSLSHLKLKKPKAEQRDITVTAIARLADIIPDLQKKARPRSSHDTNFSNVQFRGHDFAFGLVQADIIRQLHKAAILGKPKVHFKQLFVESGSQSMRMRDIFKRHDDWKILVKHDNRGYYWLHPDFIDDIMPD